MDASDKIPTSDLEELGDEDIQKGLSDSDSISLNEPIAHSDDDEEEEEEEDEGEGEEEGEEDEGEGEEDEGGDEEEEEKVKEADKQLVDKQEEMKTEKKETPGILPLPESADEATDDESDDENALKKLEQDIHKEYLAAYHPEVKQINYTELLALCKVVRNSSGKIIDELHKTIPFMTKYERTRILGLRAKQINNGSEIFINASEDMIDGYTIAEQELKEKKIPFIIRRPLPNGASEYWRTEDLEVINY